MILARTLALVGLASGLGGGCALEAVGHESDAGSGPDVGVFPHADAGAADLGSAIDGARPATPSPEGNATATASADYRGSELDSCYDGVDNNLDGRADCQDPGCQVLPSCCPSVGTCCDAPDATTLPDFASCSGTLVGCGLPGVELFGTGAPRADTDGLFPGGDRTDEGGLVLDAPLDRTRTTTVTATLLLPSATDCAPPCIDSVALGLITDTALGATTTVRPVIAVVASASLQEVLLVSGDVVLASMPIDAALGGSLDVTLALAATGAAVATVAGTTLDGVVPMPTTALHLAVYGHNENRAGVLSARALHLTLTQSTCDAPSIWATRGLVSIGAGGGSAPAVVEAPSVAYAPSDARLAFATSAGIFVAHRALAAGTPASYALQSGFGAPDVVTVPGSEELADPDLQFVTGGTVDVWRIYVANRATGALETIEADDAPTLAFRAPAPMLAPSALTSAMPIDALDGPSVVLGAAGRAGAVLAARARYHDGHAAIVLLAADDGLTHWDWLNGSEAGATVVVPSGLGDVGHDEVASPSLVYRNGAWELYYSGRTLGRSAIGLMLSDDLVHWRAAPTPAVLAATGAPSDFDAFSVRDPGIGLVAGDARRIELFYAGTDGVTTRLGRVERAATIVDAR